MAQQRDMQGLTGNRGSAPAAKQGQCLVPQRLCLDLHLQPVKRTPHATLQPQYFSQKFPASRQLRRPPSLLPQPPPISRFPPS